MTTNKLFQKAQARVEHTLKEHLASPEANTAFGKAFAYVLKTPGKYFRAALIFAIEPWLDHFSSTMADTFATAVECIHTYSLVHDDLPAMDDDDLRRGQPACHKAFDEATAILVGDALQCCAFELLSHPRLESSVQQLTCLHALTEACGPRGMVMGQALDMAASASSKDASLALLQDIHHKKTGALLQTCLLAPAKASGLSNSSIEALQQFSRHLGVAYQIRDDILDVEENTHQLGKPQYSDMQKDKLTYPALLGVEASKIELNKHLTNAEKALDSVFPKADDLRALLHSLQLNEKGAPDDTLV